MTADQKIGKFMAGVIVLAVMPLLWILAWNHLFSNFYTIEYTFLNWAAVAVISGTIKLTAK